MPPQMKELIQSEINSMVEIQELADAKETEKPRNPRNLDFYRFTEEDGLGSRGRNA
jgi:hypothetical protein